MTYQLKRAKVNLYRMLLEKEEDLTDTEINIMAELANDKDIQEVLKM